MIIVFIFTIYLMTVIILLSLMFIKDEFSDERETNLAAVIAASCSSGQTDIVSELLIESE